MKPFINRIIKTIRVKEDEYLGSFDKNEYVDTQPGEYVKTDWNIGVKDLYTTVVNEVDTEIAEIYCPMCDKYFDGSTYLCEQIKDDKVLWIANMVMHYRHNHTKYDNTWSARGYGSKNLTEDTYNTEKGKYNERAKRQIIRKCKDYMNYFSIGIKHIILLEKNDQKTMEIAKKFLNSKNT